MFACIAQGRKSADFSGIAPGFPPLHQITQTGRISCPNELQPHARGGIIRKVGQLASYPVGELAGSLANR